MDILFEFVFEIIVEGAFEVATSESRRVPVPLRILCMLFIVVLFGGITFMVIFCGVILARDGNWVLAILLFAVAVLFIGGLVRKIIGFSRKRTR